MSKKNKCEIYKSPIRDQYAVIGLNRFMVDSEGFIQRPEIWATWEQVELQWILQEKNEGEKQVLKYLTKSIK